MMNDYRIKKITRGDKVKFRAQRKYLWWWIDLSYEYSHYDTAIHYINEDINNRNPVIEYLDVTPDKLAQEDSKTSQDAL